MCMTNEDKHVLKVMLGRGILGSQSNRNHTKRGRVPMFLVLRFAVDFRRNANCMLVEESEKVNIIRDVHTNCKM